MREQFINLILKGLRRPLQSEVRVMYDNTDDVFTYVFVRKDIPIANQIVQVAHACQEAGDKYEQPKESSTLILFEVKDEDALLAGVKRAQMEGVDMHLFYEPDFPKGYTAACSEPIMGERRRAFQKFKLWKP